MPLVVQQNDSGLIGRPKLTCVTYTAAVVRSMARRWPLRCQLYQSVRASVDKPGASCGDPVSRGEFTDRRADSKSELLAQIELARPVQL